MTTAEIRTFPWHALDGTTRAEALAAAGARRAARELAHVDALAEAVGALTLARVTARVRSAVHAHPATAELRADGVGVILARADDATARDAVLIEAEPALAATLVARALKRAPPAVVDPSRVTSNAIAGALGAVLVAAARRAHAGAPLLVLGAGASRSLVQSLGPELHVATLTVLVNNEAFVARAIFPAARAAGHARTSFGRPALAALGDMPLSLFLVASATTARASEIAALEPGDAWMPGAWALGRPGALQGPLSLAAGTSEHGIGAVLGEGGRLVVRGNRVALAWMGEERTAMNDQDKTTEGAAFADALGDVPVVVRVEIGAVQMAAREWAALANGDIVATGQKIADPVVLRVGGVEVARGELVDIEGEIGVRILARSSENRA